VHRGVERVADRVPDSVRYPPGAQVTRPEDYEREAREDAHSALVCLQLSCMALRRSQPTWTRESLDHFIDFAKQQLNVIATAAPFMPKEEK